MLAATHRSSALVNGSLAFCIVSAVGVAGAVLLYFVEPTTAPLFPMCPFHALTGLHCPGCGTSRALHQLLHGDIVAALDFNVLSTLFVPVIAWTWISHGLQTMGHRPLPSIQWRPAALWTLLAVVVLFWIARNLPFYPLTVLAP